MRANANKTPKKSGCLFSSSNCRQNRNAINWSWNHVLLIRCVVADIGGWNRVHRIQIGSYFFLGTTEFSSTRAGHARILTKVRILVLLVVEPRGQGRSRGLDRDPGVIVVEGWRRRGVLFDIVLIFLLFSWPELELLDGFCQLHGWKWSMSLSSEKKMIQGVYDSRH